MPIKDIREKSKGELEKDLVDFRNKLSRIKFDIATKQVKNHREVRKLKRDIACLLTVLREKSNL